MIRLFPAVLLIMTSSIHLHADLQPLPIISASASSEREGDPASHAIDKNASDTSRWVSKPSEAPHWIEVKLAEPADLAGLHIRSGYEQDKPIRDFAVQFWRDGIWVTIPSAEVSGNTSTRLVLRFDDTVRVHTDRIRLLITATPDHIARVGEIIVWPMSAAGVPDLLQDQLPPSLVFLNQRGFNSGAPKRFTAPLAADGADFHVFHASDPEMPVFSGVIERHVGDFSAFEPTEEGEFFVQVGNEKSVPFSIGNWLLERTTYQRSVDFMIDSRHYVGNDRSICPGSFGWRDDHHFGWELHTLVPQWLSNPSAYSRMPRQINYESPENPALWGKLEPPHPDAPDLVKLIHWGADVIVTQGTTHEMLKSQLAYFLYAWPWIKQYLPDQNYNAVRDFAFSHWSESAADQDYPYDESKDHDLLALKPHIGSTKGTYPPGFSIQPNLLMHAVALREGRPDADAYLEAAVRQAAWIIENVDWDDPLTTKGQRVSEFLTITGLAHLLSEHPTRAPQGLKQKLSEWADVAIRRSENLWDFRKLGDAADQWTPTGNSPTAWNEPGNVVGFPAIIFSLLPHLDDTEKKHRLEQMAWAHFDAMFGRNPSGRHFSYDAPRELEGVRHGWYSFLPGGIGRLAEARFVIDGSPKNQHYPYHPEVGNVGWTEGWIQHNTPFNLSLAYLARHSTSLHLMREGEDLVVRLEAPLNFDSSRRESATVELATPSGGQKSLLIEEECPDSRFLIGRLPISECPGAGSEPILATYGHGYLSTTALLKL